MNESESKPEIDFEHLKQYVGDDIDLTKEVFGLFKHQAEMWLLGLQPDADDDHWVSVMHSFKGSARAVGAANLAALCEKGEGLIGTENKPAIRKKLDQDIRFCIDRVKIEIQRWEYRQTLAGLRS
jgi:HPt (histidine-containing phosphotransfer) domain-containing protein